MSWIWKSNPGFPVMAGRPSAGRRDSCVEVEENPDMAAKTVANIFLIYSPLHYLAAESVAVHFEPGARNYLFYLKHEFKDLAHPSKWDGVNFLPWPRFYPKKGFFGGMRRAGDNLRLVGALCAGATTIRLHTPVIDTEAVNYLINFLRGAFPGAAFSVRIIPDGLLNIRRHPLGRLKRMLQYLKKLKRVFCPELDYYTFSGDRIGSDDAIVDRIYLLPRFPHQYDPGKVAELPALVPPAAGGHEGARVPRALVVGQPLVDFKRMTTADVELVTQGMRRFIGDCGISEIDYKAHPKDSRRELDSSGYRDLKITCPLEIHLSRHSYDLVIGVYSTALLTAKMVLPESSRVVAYGMNRMQFRGDSERGDLELSFDKFRVEIVDA